MRTDIPRVRLTVFAVAALLAVGLFLYLNSTFGGPTLLPGGGAQYELRASFPDSQNIVTKSLVMYRGFQIGTVTSVSIVHAQAQVTFTVSGKYTPLPQGTIAQIDHRTFLQEAFVNILVPARVRAVPGIRSGSVVRSIPTVEPDDALQVFDPETRRLLDEGTSSLARGLSASGAAHEVSGTLSGLDGVLTGIHGVTGALQGQEGEISSLMSAGATVLDAVASQQRQLAGLIGSGRVVAQTFAAQNHALGSGLDQLNGLLSQAQTTLPRLRPLTTLATPVLRQAAAAATELRPGLSALAPVLAEVRTTSLALDPSARAAVPALTATLAAARALAPLAVTLTPAMANLVPLMGYIRSQLGGFESFIGNVAATVDHGDSAGPWLQGFLDVTTGGLIGGDAGCKSTIGLCVNPYPKPGDASDPQPFAPGSYPRLTPYFSPGGTGTRS
ncbi:MAG TPA: MlaD family protein [Solirubrobacteraceae bacterium]|jgi:virulence factor Mce-like protein|nr:MlaD family protein [Solirubrobacteraceae bacterium]